MSLEKVPEINTSHLEFLKWWFDDKLLAVEQVKLALLLKTLIMFTKVSNVSNELQIAVENAVGSQEQNADDILPS